MFPIETQVNSQIKTERKTIILKTESEEVEKL